MKSIEEAAKEFSSYEPVQIGFKGGVEFAQRWIDVNCELPKNDYFVLVKGKNGLVEVGWYEKDYNSFSVNDIGLLCVSDITHWRPIEYK